jgi:hypothetical protein
VDERAAALFELPPDRFTAERDRLAAELREAGDGEGARTVKALRRPTVPAWALNQASRRRPDAVSELLEAGGALREAHAALLGGGPGDPLRRARTRRAAAVDVLLLEARDVLEGAGRPASQTHRDAIVQTLEAASVEEEAGKRLRSGTLEREADAPTGFEAFGDIAPPAPTPEAPPKKGRTDRRARLEEEADEAERRAAEADRRAREAEEDADRAEREAIRLRRAAERARDEADRARARAEDRRRRAAGTS